MNRYFLSKTKKTFSLKAAEAARKMCFCKVLSFSFMFLLIKVVIHVYMAVVVTNIVQSTVKTTCAKYSMENVLSAWLDGWDLFVIRVKNLIY